MKRKILTIAISAIATMAIIFLGIKTFEAVASNHCYSVASLMQVDAQYSLSTGCMVKPSDRWVPLSAVYFEIK